MRLFRTHRAPSRPADLVSPAGPEGEGTAASESWWASFLRDAPRQGGASGGLFVVVGILGFLMWLMKKQDKARRNRHKHPRDHSDADLLRMRGN